MILTAMSRTMSSHSWPYWPLVGFLALTFAIGGIGGWITADSVRVWYEPLAKPAWTPPQWVFSPVWSTLYVLMSVAAFLVWQRPHSAERRTALSWFFLQLFFNAIWTPVFFGLHSLGWALAIILMLDASLAWTIYRFSRMKPLAAWLLAPYLAWVLYATSLNWGVLVLNG